MDKRMCLRTSRVSRMSWEVRCLLRVYPFHTDPVQVIFLGLGFLVISYKLIISTFQTLGTQEAKSPKKLKFGMRTRHLKYLVNVYFFLFPFLSWIFRKASSWKGLVRPIFHGSRWLMQFKAQKISPKSLSLYHPYNYGNILSRSRSRPSLSLFRWWSLLTLIL